MDQNVNNGMQIQAKVFLHALMSIYEDALIKKDMDIQNLNSIIEMKNKQQEENAPE